MINKLKRAYRYIFRNPPKYRISINVKSEKHGSDYGGWTIVKNSLNENSKVFSFGIGNDITFDESIIAKYGCLVHGFDPTPRVAIWVGEQSISDKFLFYPTGIASKDGIISFYEPTNPDYISHSAIDLGNSNQINVPCKRLSTILSENNIGEVDVLKIDIEGFEYEVIPDIIESKIRPKQFLIEFHHMFEVYGNKPTEDAIHYLENHGYKLFHVSDTFTEFSFLDIQQW